MKGFVAAVAAMFAAGVACASGSLPFDVPDGGDPSEGGTEAHDGGGTTEAGGVAGEDGGRDAADSSVYVAGDTGVDSRPDAGSSDAGVDADAGVSPTLVGSCDPAQWNVSASVSAPNNPPEFAVDGLLPTSWFTGAATGQAVGQYFRIDFGGFVVVDQITLNDNFGSTEALDYPRGVEVLGSADGINFPTTLGTASFATSPGAIATINFPPGTVRALQMQLTTGVAQQPWSIHELQLGCQLPDGGTGEVPDGGAADAACALTYATWTANSGISSASWVGSASSTNPTDSDSIQGAFDGNADTRWSSGIPQGEASGSRLTSGRRPRSAPWRSISSTATSPTFRPRTRSSSRPTI